MNENELFGCPMCGSHYVFSTRLVGNVTCGNAGCPISKIEMTIGHWQTRTAPKSIKSSFKGSCVSEQGKSGLLWTVFEGEPLCSDRIASFSSEYSAREYMKLKGHQDFTTAVETDSEILQLYANLAATKSTEADLVLALKSYQAVVATILSEEGGDITLWWDRLIDSQIGGAKAILECKSTEAEGDKERVDVLDKMLTVNTATRKVSIYLDYTPDMNISLRDIADKAIANEKGEK